MSKCSTREAIESAFSQFGRWSVGVGLAVGSITAAVPALAQESGNDAATPAPTRLKEVVIKAEREAPGYKPEHLSSIKFAQPLLDTAQSVTVVPKEVLGQQNAQNLQDVLKNVPGITFTSGEGNLGWGDMFTIRGFSSEQSLTVDGMRDAGMSSRNDTFNIEQVEVFKGTGSIESGTASVGGTVNLVSKEARLENFYNVSAGIGTDAYARGSADLNRKLGAHSAVRINLMKHHNEVAERDAVKYQREGVAASLGLGLGTDTRMWFDLFHQEDNNVPDGGVPIQRGTGGQRMPGVARSAWFGADTYMQQTRADTATVRLEHDFSSEVRLRNQLRWSNTDNLSVLAPARFNAATARGATLGTSLGYSGTGSLTSASGVASYSDVVNHADAYGVMRGSDYGTSKRYKVVANQTDVSVKFATGALQHELITGLDLYRETYGDLARTVMAPSGTLWFDMAHPSTVFPSVAVLKGGAGVVSQVDNAGAYVTDTIRFNPQWRLLAALRYDHWKAETTTRGALNARSSDGTLSGRLSVMYKPVENASLYAAYAQADQPSAMGATTNNAIYGSAAASAYTPAKSRTAELGAKWDVLHKRLALTGAVFRTEVSDSWEYGDNAASPVRALPSKRVDGFELGVQGNVTAQWSVFGGLSHLDSKQTKGINSGAEAKNVADWTGNLWTSYAVTPGLYFSYGAQYVGQRRYSDNRYVGGLNNNSSTVSGAAGNHPVYVLDTEKAASYWLHSVAARYRINNHVALNVNVANLFNKFHYARIGASLDGFQLYGVPGAGRTATASVDLTF